ncbi:MAG: ATP-binding protein [Desulfatitalea sp.]|nr:ATP-binding protein [Desulfatitalea sp.]
MLPNRRYTAKRLNKARETLEQDLEAHMNAWRVHVRSEIADWKKDIEMSRLRLQIAVTCMETTAAINHTFSERLRPHFTGLNQMIGRFIDVVAQSEMESENPTDRLRKEGTALLQTIRETALPTLIDTFIRFDPLQDFEKYSTRIGNAVEQVSNTHIIFQSRHFSELMPKSKTENIPLKELITEDILSKSIPAFQSFSGNIRERFQHILRRAGEIDQIVEFNLNATLGLLHEVPIPSETPDSGQQATRDAFGRAVNQIEVLSQELDQLLADINRDLPGKAGWLMGEIQTLADNQAIISLKMRLTEAKSREKLRSLHRRLWKQASNRLSTAKEKCYHFFRTIRNSYLLLRKISGLAETSERNEAELSLFLSETQQRMGRLPAIYRALFQSEPLSDSRLFTGRVKETQRFQEKIGTWREGHPIAVALIGEKGSGKTSFINMLAAQSMESERIVRLELDDTIIEEGELIKMVAEAFACPHALKWEQLTDAVEAGDGNFVCVVENIHNLFVRTLDGFSVLESFLLFASNTLHRIFWLVSCTYYDWRYLDRIVSISKYFNGIIELGALSREETTDIILTRHRLSGFTISYEKPTDTRQHRKLKKLPSDADRQAFLQRQFFDQLTEHSAGNIRVAMNFWLSAITETAGDQLRISAAQTGISTSLHQLEPEELFALAALIQHDRINRANFARIFNLPPDDSIRMLNQMKARGILLREGDAYVIHHFLYRPVVRMLKAKNIL